MAACRIDEEASALRAAFETAGQGQVFRWWDELDEAGRAGLLGDAASIDLEELHRLYETYVKGSERSEDAAIIEPVEGIRLASSEEGQDLRRRARAAGEALLREGRVACFVVAGGQGTRLGFDGPKGAFPVGPVTERSLFQVFVEGIRAAARRHGRSIPFYVMTSPGNDEATRSFFADHDRFGLAPEDLQFFTQGQLPAVDSEGKILLSARDRIALCPDGHGGSLDALVASGAVADMKARGITHLSYFQVDNALVKVVDPLFLGHHLLEGARMSVKAVAKSEASEKVGVVARVGGRIAVVEYSDLSDEEATRRLPSGRLAFDMGNIAVHVIDVDFVEELAAGKGLLPHHVARKKVPYVDGAGQLRRPEVANGIKFERFVFDAMPLSKAVAVLEVERREEFAPIKNGEGSDSPESARRLVCERHARWFEEAGHRVPRDEKGQVAVPIEISPLFAMDSEELRRRLDGPVDFSGGLALGPFEVDEES